MLRKRRGLLLRPTSLLFCACWAAGVCGPAHGATGTVEALVAQARGKDLHEHDYWRLLLHYKTGIRGAVSRIDDPAFFLSPVGKTDPRDEMSATIRAFFEQPGTNTREHAACRFPARLEWLKTAVPLPAEALPLPRCEDFEHTFRVLDPRSITLSFPCTYINNPASMFGHTLLVIDPARKNRLLAKTISYAGRTDGGFAPAFIIGSFLGWYPGRYSFKPYYDKVEEYRDIASRDIWEYELDLDREEIRRLLLHAWELQGIFSDYYFLGENCSFNLLHLLDAARPALELHRQFGPWVIPVDTVKAVEQAGIVRDKHYRPSKVTVIEHLAGRTSERQQRLAESIARGRAAATNVFTEVQDGDAQIMTLSLAAEYVQYLYTERTITPEEYRPLFLNTLRARSRLARPNDDVFRVPAPVPPDEGHDSSRVAVGAGMRDDEPFVRFAYRPAYHALLDDGHGFQPGSQIEFMSFDFRYYPDDNRVRLETWDFFDILSVSPRDRFFKPNSWRAVVGTGHRRFSDNADDLVARVHVGSGYGYRQGLSGLSYALLDVKLEGGSVYSDGYAAGVGVSVGALWDPVPRWKLGLQAEGAYLWGRAEAFETLRASLRQNLRLSRNHALALTLSRRRNDGFCFNEAELAWNWFF